MSLGMAGFLLLSILLLIFMIVFKEVRTVLGTVETIEYEPVLIGENYRCPTCKAFWYMKDEEVHFKGCLVPIINRIRKAHPEGARDFDEAQLRRGSSQK